MDDRTLRLWRVSTGAQLRNYTQEIGYGIESVEFSPLGDTFVYARADGVVVVARNPLYVPPIEGDVNRDDCVDDLDLLRVLFAFGRTDTGLREDVNRDGVVDDGDLLLVLSNFGQGCE
ncbi:MAG: hypothetical protein KatS3mg020_0704 [Fimbriimonadales bacterium]|nr:MAG: hypothetical protein KatS3mg020_0704 [Fimbriimonadales bacterium]